MKKGAGISCRKARFPQGIMESNSFFAQTRPMRLFFAVALPGMVSMLAMSVYSVIEGVFIGRILGEAAFAAVNLAMPFVMINFSLADLIGVGSSVPISISLGRQEKEQADNYFTCSVILIFSAAIAMGLLLFFGSPLLMRLMGAEGELAVLAVKYVRVYAIMGPVTTLFFAVDNYLRICGFVRFSMLLNIFMSLLTACLVFLFLVVGKMNVEGSALATGSSMAGCALIATVPFLRKKTLLRFVKPRFSLGMIGRIVSCGAPTFLSNVAGRVASIVLNSALLRVGGQTAVAAYSVLMYSCDTIQPLLYGMSDSVQPAIGYNWGARAFGRVKSLAKCVFVACGTVSLIGTAIMFFFPEQITSLFVRAEETELFTLTVHAMRLFCVAYLVRWFGFAVQGFYTAIEKSLPASILSVSGAMIFPVLLVFALSPWGLDGLWLNLAGTSLLVTVMAFFMLRYTQKKIGGLLKEPLSEIKER